MLSKRDIYVKNFDQQRSYLRLFDLLGYLWVYEFERANVVCLTGGSDVNPALYGEKALDTTGFIPERDEEDRALFDAAALSGKKIIGICRGAQYAHVRMGGRLFQHVTTHTRMHPLVFDGVTYEVTSTHHQMMRDVPPGCEVLATADQKNCHQFDSSGVALPVPPEPQIEICTHTFEGEDKPRVLCFQPHPEMDLHGETMNLFHRVLEKINFI